MPEKKATQKPTEMPKDPKLEEARAHMHAAFENVHKIAESMIPEGLRDNQRAARKEFLLGLRSLVEAAIERVDKPVK